MSVAPNTEQTPPQAGPPPETNGESGKVYTQEELDRKLRGSAKERATLEARLAAFEAEEAKRAQAKQTEAEQLAELRNETKTLADKLKAKEAAETAELAEVAAENEATLKDLKLSKEEKQLVAVMSELPPKQLRKALAAFVASRVSVETRSVHGGAGRAGQPEDPTAAAVEAGRAMILGKAKGGAK